MDRPSRLADLTLVNKYYPPVGVANFSYPSPKLDTLQPCDCLVGRSSMGSEASVPGMTDDGDSMISTDEDDKSFYHVSGAELWDKFWEDPFWEANAEEAEREAEGRTQRVLGRIGSYPALIPSPDEHRQKDQYFLESGESSRMPESHPPLTRPSTATPSTTSTRPVTPTVSYSLFPKQSPTPPAVLSLSPRRAAPTPRSTSLWGTPAFNDSTSSLNSLGRSSRVRKVQSDVPHANGRSSWTILGAAIPQPALPSPPGFEFPARRDSGQSTRNLNQRFPIRTTRIRSDTHASRPSITSAPRSPIVDIPAKDLPLRSPHLTIHFQTPPRTPHHIRGRHSQPEPLKVPPPLHLHRSTTATEAPSLPQPRHSRVYAHTNPNTPTMPTHAEAAAAAAAAAAMPVSFFDFDSDSDEDEAATSFARRIARSFTSQVRTRSASAAPRSRRGLEVAKLQLRRARAETVGLPAEEEALPAEAGRVEEKGARGRPPMLRKQKSEVFGKIFWRR